MADQRDEPMSEYPEICPDWQTTGIWYVKCVETEEELLITIQLGAHDNFDNQSGTPPRRRVAGFLKKGNNKAERSTFA